MTLIINGMPRDHEAPDIEALFRIEAGETGIESAQGVAIALNGRVVPRRDWARTPLGDGDRVEIVRAMQGG